MKSIKEIKNLKGVRVLLRLDLNVPVENGSIVDDFRIKRSLPILEYLYEKGAQTIIISHIESVKKGDKESLEPVSEYLKKSFNVTFVKNYRNVLLELEHISDGSMVLLENLRHWEGEKTNDEKFSKELASLADIYVNDAFSVCHRGHASVVGIPKYLPSYAGLQLEDEIKNLSMCFDPLRPFTFILGGAKFDTKLPLINKFLDIADCVYVAGALANDFFSEKGMDIGDSLVSKTKFDLKGIIDNPKLVLPVDVLREENKILDVGPETLKQLKEIINKSKFVLWNGPLGAYENGFKKPTLELAKIIAESGVKSVIGGGDTLAAISELGIENKFTFVSTGGGAMLDYLANGTLPGIEALG
ncbi:MAG: phosphoglycerate kinase [Candidatus Taylorbacteria bacterium]|nr:phosphoglycerate kinase [Candidatus Taylorbacteria bacterium]